MAVLDVATHLQTAISLYENCRWIRAGQVDVGFGDGTTLEEFIYLRPRPPTA